MPCLQPRRHQTKTALSSALIIRYAIISFASNSPTFRRSMSFKVSLLILCSSS